MSLPTSPLSSRLLLWWNSTGDTIDQMAAGFGVPTELFRSVMLAERDSVSFEEAALLCRQLRLSPDSVWANFVPNDHRQWTPDDGVVEAWPYSAPVGAVA